MRIIFRLPRAGIQATVRRYSSKKSTVRHKSQSNADYCLDLVKQYDYEGFLATLLIPGDSHRTTAFAVRAFNVEISLVSQRVSNVTIGQGRFHFWQDFIKKLNKNNTNLSPQHPVAQEITRAFHRHTLNKTYLQRLITCREKHLGSKGFATIVHLEHYAEESMSPVFYLLLQSSGCKDITVDHINAAGHLGKALGLTNALRSLSKIKTPNELLIPKNLFAKFSITQDTFLSRKVTAPGFKDIIFDVASTAKRHLDQAKAVNENVPNIVKPMFLPAVPISKYLELLRRVDFDPYHPRLHMRSFTLPISMWWSKYKNTY